MKENESQSVVLYSIFSRRLASGGISKEELDSIRHLPIGHHSLEDFVEANIKLGNFAWRGELLMNAGSRLTLKLTREEAKLLKQRAREAEKPQEELATDILLQGLLGK